MKYIKTFFMEVNVHAALLKSHTNQMLKGQQDNFWKWCMIKSVVLSGHNHLYSARQLKT